MYICFNAIASSLDFYRMFISHIYFSIAEILLQQKASRQALKLSEKGLFQNLII
jgi:hypothetical protein